MSTIISRLPIYTTDTMLSGAAGYTALHSQVEQEGFARRDLRAISDVIEGRNYIVGQQMSAYDFVVAGMLSEALDHQPPGWVTKMADVFSELRRFATAYRKKLVFSANNWINRQPGVQDTFRTTGQDRLSTGITDEFSPQPN